MPACRFPIRPSRAQGGITTGAGGGAGEITGDRNAPSLPNFAAALKDPSQFLQQYRYQQDATADNGTAPPAVMFDLTRTGTPAIPLTGLSLWAKFDPDVLNHAVRDADEPLWGRNGR